MQTQQDKCYEKNVEHRVTSSGVVMTNDYDPERFGKVLATLEAQNAVLAGLREDVNKIYGIIYTMQNEKRSIHNDWVKLFASAIAGAVAYFVAQKFMT